MDTGRVGGDADEDDDEDEVESAGG